jgi:glyoxylate utilization-related uncharacterized protein
MSESAYLTRARERLKLIERRFQKYDGLEAPPQYLIEWHNETIREIRSLKSPG